MWVSGGHGHSDHLKEFSLLCQVLKVQRFKLKQVQLQKVQPTLKNTTAGDNVLNMLDRNRPGGLKCSVNTRPLPANEVQTHSAVEESSCLIQGDEIGGWGDKKYSL